MKIPLSLGPSYTRETLNDVQRCINWYPEKTGEGYNLLSTHGLTLAVTVGNNQPCRGAYMTSTGSVFSVHNNKVYSFDLVNTATEIGTVSAISGLADMTDDGTYLIIADSNGAGYTYKFSNGVFAAQSDGNYPAAASVTMQDRRAIVGGVSGGHLFYLSELADSRDWTPVRSANAEYSGDYLLGVRSVGGRLYLLGAKTIEPWYNTGNASFTYERVTGASVDIGVVDMKTVAVMDGAIYFLSAVSGGSVWRIGAEGVEKLSTPYVESRISLYSLSDATAFAFAYKKNGHAFYQLTPSTSSALTGEVATTWVYDITEGTWFQKASSISGAQSYHRARFILNASDRVAGFTDKPIAFDAVNGKIYFCKDSDNTEDGTAITRTRDLGPIEAGANRIFHTHLRFDFEMDYDSSATPTFTPTLTKTDDAGKSFSTVDMGSRALTLATSAQRVQMWARRLGSSRERTYRLVTTEAARMILKLAELEAEMGAH